MGSEPSLYVPWTAHSLVNRRSASVAAEAIRVVEESLGHVLGAVKSKAQVSGTHRHRWELVEDAEVDLSRLLREVHQIDPTASVRLDRRGTASELVVVTGAPSSRAVPVALGFLLLVLAALVVLSV